MQLHTVPDWLVEQGFSSTFLKRFWSKVNKGQETECWNWIGGKDSYGYGGIFKGKKHGGAMISSRASWLIHNGKLPTLQVLHTCDNPACVNPNHLFLGTQTDNMRDCARKGRSAFQIHPEKIARGSNHPMRKLDEDKVSRIRQHYATTKESQYAIAERYGVCVMTINLIINRKIWTHC